MCKQYPVLSVWLHLSSCPGLTCPPVQVFPVLRPGQEEEVKMTSNCNCMPEEDPNGDAGVATLSEQPFKPGLGPRRKGARKLAKLYSSSKNNNKRRENKENISILCSFIMYWSK